MPETTRGRDKMERARIWTRDRMAQTMLELEGYQTAALNLCKINDPQAKCIGVMANITELTMELTNARLHVARHAKAWN